MTSSATELLSQYIELNTCRSQCEAHLSRMMADQLSSQGFMAMELAAIIRHDRKLRQLERDLRQLQVPVPAFEYSMQHPVG